MVTKANNHTEVEARWINLDRKQILKKLKEIGAKKTGDHLFEEWIFDKPEWRSQFRRVRIRTNGKKTWLTYKANPTWAIDGTQEIEVMVSSPNDTVDLLKAIDLPLVRHMEKKRMSFSFDGIDFDLDTWPGIPMVLEIESSSEEKIKEGAKLLGLKWEDAIFEDQLVVHKKYYNIDLHQITEYCFE